jgi:hypothetical protein
MDEPKPETNSPQSPLTIDQAFQRLLERSGKPYIARRRLDEAFLAGEAPLWGRLAHDEPWFLVKPDYYQSQQYFIEVREGPEGWKAKLDANTAQQGKSESRPGRVVGFKDIEWRTSAEKIDALCQPDTSAAAEAAKAVLEVQQHADEERQARIAAEAQATAERERAEAAEAAKAVLEVQQHADEERHARIAAEAQATAERERAEAATRSVRMKPGRKEQYDWALFQAQFYLILYDEDLPANAEININEKAGKLMLWGQNHPDIGPEKTPGDTAMRAGVKEWAPRWRVLGQR